MWNCESSLWPLKIGSCRVAQIFDTITLEKWPHLMPGKGCVRIQDDGNPIDKSHRAGGGHAAREVPTLGLFKNRGRGTNGASKEQCAN